MTEYTCRENRESNKRGNRMENVGLGGFIDKSASAKPRRRSSSANACDRRGSVGKKDVHKSSNIQMTPKSRSREVTGSSKREVEGFSKPPTPFDDSHRKGSPADNADNADIDTDTFRLDMIGGNSAHDRANRKSSDGRGIARRRSISLDRGIATRKMGEQFGSHSPRGARKSRPQETDNAQKHDMKRSAAAAADVKPRVKGDASEAFYLDANRGRSSRPSTDARHDNKLKFDTAVSDDCPSPDRRKCRTRSNSLDRASTRRTPDKLVPSSSVRNKKSSCDERTNPDSPQKFDTMARSAHAKETASDAVLASSGRKSHRRSSSLGCVDQSRNMAKELGSLSPHVARKSRSREAAGRDLPPPLINDLTAFLEQESFKTRAHRRSSSLGTVFPEFTITKEDEVNLVVLKAISADMKSRSREAPPCSPNKIKRQSSGPADKSPSRPSRRDKDPSDDGKMNRRRSISLDRGLMKRTDERGSLSNRGPKKVHRAKQ